MSDLLSNPESIDRNGAVDLLYAVIQGVIDFLEEYPGRESEVLTNALRTSVRLVQRTCREDNP